MTVKIVDNKGIHAKSGRSIQHRIEDKSALSYRTNSDGLAKKNERGIQSIPSDISPVLKKENSADPAREIYQRKTSVKTDGKHRITGMQAESTRTIQKRRLPTNAPKKAVKRDLSRLHLNRNNPFKHKKLRLKIKNKKDFPMTGKSLGESIPKGGVSPINIAKSAITKPASMVGNKLLSQRADFSKTEDTGTETIKLGLQTVDYARRGVRGIKSAVQAPRKIYKGVKRTVNGTKRVIKTSAKAVQNAAKAARATARAAAKAAQATVKITVKIVQAAAQAVGKIVSLIAETMPYSLIVIAVIVVVLLLMYLINMIAGSAGSAVGAVGGWAASGASDESGVYNNIQEYISNVKSALENDVQKSLKKTVDDFCALWYHENGCRTDSEGNRYCDGHVKSNVLEFKSDNQNAAYYPGRDGMSEVDGYIDNFKDQFDSEFYADFLAALYVLKAREMQNSDDSSVTVFDLEITDSDIAELIKTVDTNSCNFGQTYFHKTTENTTGKCPGESCSTEYRDDNCCTDENGNSYCGGHPYCPGTHDKLIVKLYSTEKYTSKKPEEIYGFSDEEKAQYTAVKEFIKAINSIEGGESSEVT